MKVSLRKMRSRVRSAQIDAKQVKERRKTLKTLGRAALYTPPALLALLKSSRAKVSV